MGGDELGCLRSLPSPLSWVACLPPLVYCELQESEDVASASHLYFSILVVICLANIYRVPKLLTVRVCLCSWWIVDRNKRDRRAAFVELQVYYWKLI